MLDMISLWFWLWFSFSFWLLYYSHFCPLFSNNLECKL